MARIKSTASPTKGEVFTFPCAGVEGHPGSMLARHPFCEVSTWLGKPPCKIGLGIGGKGIQCTQSFANWSSRSNRPCGDFRIACQRHQPVCRAPCRSEVSTSFLKSRQTRLYVGRTNNLRRRLRNHCGLDPKTAAFAMRLARNATGRKATYKKEGGREELMSDPEFMQAFETARVRIAKLHVRYVEETDPLRQCLLEVYVHVALGTPFNDFDNH